MKHLLIFLALNCAANLAQAQQSLTIEPARPVQGSSIRISYDPSRSDLSGKEGIEAVAYLMEGQLPRAKEVALARQGNAYVGTVETSDTTLAVFLAFIAGDKWDNNRDKGYYTILYDKKGEPVPGGRFAVGEVFSNTGVLWGLKRNADAGRALMKEDFALHPSLKDRYFNGYLNMMLSSKDSADRRTLRAEIERVLADPKATEQQLEMVAMGAERGLKDKSLQDRVRQRIRTEYPNGSWKKSERVALIQEEKDAVKREEAVMAYLRDFPPMNTNDSNQVDYLYMITASQYARSGNVEKTWEYEQKVRHKGTLANIFNSIAWKEAGEGINGQPGNVRLGLLLSEQALNMFEAEKRNPTDKQSYYTDKQWQKELDNNYFMYADTYALLLYRDGQYEKALEIQKRAVDNAQGKNRSMNEAYTVYLEKVKGPEAAMKELESMVRSGYNTAAMTEQYKRLYLAAGHTEDQWKEYNAAMKKAMQQKQMEEIEKNMIKEAAPAFKLKDVDGKEVSLASLRGKVVVVDFWATWCGPCIQSFPGMKKAQEQHASDPDVKFLFVDTWESGEDAKKKEAAIDFMKKNNYPFHVLMDFDNGTVEQYGVEGIPTKFVIDRNGQVRFRSVGFGGDTDALAEELARMIELAKKG